MIAVAVVARHWRAALLGLLLLFLLLVIALTLTNERSPSDQLPLQGVPDSAYATAGVVLYPPYGEEASFSPKGADFLAGLQVCCGKPSQTVLVRLGQVGSDSSILSYALNYDTAKAPESPPLGGKWVTSFAREMDYFVVFLDATNGEMIFRMWPGYQDPFPPVDQIGILTTEPIVARNLDGPNVFVTISGFRPITTVVACGEEEAARSDTEGPYDLWVNDASSGELLFERQLPAGSQSWILSIRHDGVVVGEESVSSEFRPKLPCR